MPDESQIADDEATEELMVAPPAAGQDLEPRDPREVDSAGESGELRGVDAEALDEFTRGELLRRAGGRLDPSLYDAQRDVLQERELSARAVVYREWPEEWQGTTIKGRVRMWRAPFTLLEIEEWIAAYRGGGKYRIRLLDGRGKYLDQKVLDVEGDPILPGEKEEEVVASAAEVVQAEDRAAVLERQLMEARFQSQRIEDRARTDSMFDRMQGSMEKIAEKLAQASTQPDSKPPLDVAALIAAAAPLVNGFLEMQASRAEAAERAAREDRKWILEQQQAAEARTAETMKALQPKKEDLADVLAGVEKLKKLTGGSDDPAKMYHTLMEKSVPILMETVSKIQLHKAGVPGEGGEEEFGAKMILDRVTDLASNFVATRAGEPAPPQADPQAGVNTHGQYGPPAQIPVGPAGASVFDGRRQVGVRKEAPQGPAQAPPQGGQPAPQQRPQADINLQVFDKALQYMAAGKEADELFDILISEEEVHRAANPMLGHLYFSDTVLKHLANNEPATILSFINPQLQTRPQYAGLLTAAGQEWLAQLCACFSSAPEGEEESKDSLETESPDVEPNGASGAEGAVS